MYDSSLSPYLMEFADVISSVAPSDLRGSFKDGYGKVKKNYWDPVEKKLDEEEQKSDKSEKAKQPRKLEKVKQ